MSHDSQFHQQRRLKLVIDHHVEMLKQTGYLAYFDGLTLQVYNKGEWVPIMNMKELELSKTSSFDTDEPRLLNGLKTKLMKRVAERTQLFSAELYPDRDELDASAREGFLLDERGSQDYEF